MIRRQGPVPFGVFMDAALYAPAVGFFSKGAGAGRAGRDFVTSPEVGPLFGALVARALDEWWHGLGAPDPYMVIEAGAGRGRLCREVLRGAPECSAALRYVLVERSASLRDAQRELLTIEPFEDALGPMLPGDGDEPPVPVPRLGPIVTALDEMPSAASEGVVIANELLDNLAFDVVERAADGWLEVRVGVDDDGRFHEVLLPAAPDLAAWWEGLDVGSVPVGARVPVQREVETWLEECSVALRKGIVLVVDYAAPLTAIASRGRGWLRTYRAHSRGSDPLDAPGSQDITADLVTETLLRSARRAGFTVERRTTQSEWLADLGIDALVEEGRTRWEAGAALGTLDALAGRSRISEAAALTDPDGLGAHVVLVLTRGPATGSGGEPRG